VKSRYDAYVRRLDALFESIEPETFPGAPLKLLSAMRYSLLGGGKRVRPVVLLAFCDALGGDGGAALPYAAALELIHTYSLVHDDLPCMDDDDFRRGKPTSHKVFGEATALLCGDALLTAAFELILRQGERDAVTAVQIGGLFAKSAGPGGMIGGQQLELETEHPDAPALRNIHALKTGALFRAAARAGALLGRHTPEQLLAADAYADNLSMAFQIQDDLLDGDGFTLLLGREGCKRRVEELTRAAKDSLRLIPNPDFLLWLADHLRERAS
jgi:geranylgeranyl diphosphate synthase type II